MNIKSFKNEVATMETSGGFAHSDKGSAKLIAVSGIAGMFLYLKFGHQFLLRSYPQFADVMHLSITATIGSIILFAIGYSIHTRRGGSRTAMEFVADVESRLGLLEALLEKVNEQIRDFEQEMLAHLSLVPARGTQALSLLKRINKAIEQRVLRARYLTLDRSYEGFRDAYCALNEKLCFVEDSYTSLIGSETLPPLEPFEWVSKVEHLLEEIDAELAKARTQAYHKNKLPAERDMFANDDMYLASEEKIKSTTLG